MGLGRERSIGRYDGSTSLTLDIVFFLFAESSICICLNHFLTQFAKIPNFIDMSYFGWSPRQRGRERIFPSSLFDGYFRKDSCLTGFSLSHLHYIQLLYC